MSSFNSEMLDTFDQSLRFHQEPETPTKSDDEEGIFTQESAQETIVEEIDPADDGLFQMLNASMKSKPTTSPKKRTKKPMNSPHRRNNVPNRHPTKSRQPPVSPPAELPLQGVVDPDDSVASNEGGRHEQSKESNGSTIRSRSSHASSSSIEEDTANPAATNHSMGSRTGRSTPSKTSSRSRSQPRNHRHSHNQNQNQNQNHRHSWSATPHEEKERRRSTSLGKRRMSTSSGTGRRHGEGAARPNRSPRSPKRPIPSAPKNAISTENDVSNEEMQSNSKRDQSPERNNEDQNVVHKEIEDEAPNLVAGMGNHLVQVISGGAKACAKEVALVAKSSKKELEKALAATKGAAHSVAETTKSITSSIIPPPTSGIDSATATLETTDVSSHENILPREDSEENVPQALAIASSHSSGNMHSGTGQGQDRPRSPKRERNSVRSNRNRDEGGDRKKETEASASKNGHPGRNQLLVSEHSGKSKNTVRTKTTGRMTVRDRRNLARRTEYQPKEPPKDHTSLESNSSSHSDGAVPMVSGARETETSLELKNQAVNNPQPSENDKEWLQARSTRQDDIMSFIKPKDGGGQSGAQGPRTMSEWPSNGDRSPRRESQESQKQEQKRKNILTEGAKVAKIAIGVTAFGAREAINTIRSPKKEMEKIMRVSSKAAEKVSRAASDPKLTAQRMASMTKDVSVGIMREATEVTKGTMQLGRETVAGTVGWLMQDGDEVELSAKHSATAADYDSQTLASRKKNDSLMDRVANVVDTPGEKNGQGTEPLRRQRRNERGPRPIMVDGMPERMPSRLVTGNTGKPTISWDT